MNLQSDFPEFLEPLLLIVMRYLEGIPGALIMCGAFLLSLSIGAVKLWKHGGRKMATAGLLLLLFVSVTALLLALNIATSIGNWGEKVIGILALGLVFSPLAVSIVLFVKRSRRAAILVTGLWLISVATFVGRALVSADSCGGTEILCGGETVPCVR